MKKAIFLGCLLALASVVSGAHAQKAPKDQPTPPGPPTTTPLGPEIVPPGLQTCTDPTRPECVNAQLSPANKDGHNPLSHH